MPQVELIQPDHHKRSLAVRYVVIGVLVVAVGGYLVWRLVPSASDTVKKTDALDLIGDHYLAYQQLKSAYDRAIFKGDKIILASRLAGDSEALDNKDLALQYYQQLDKMQPNNVKTLMSIGDLEYGQNKKSDALATYKAVLAIEQASTGPQHNDALIAGLNTTIAKLEQSQ